MYDDQLNYYLRQLHQRIYGQQERMQQMEKVISELQVELSGLKKQPRLAVDRIEYKFDQLKIERLEGTLNIGLTPKAGDELLDDLSDGDGDPSPQNDGDIEIPDHPNVAKHTLKNLDDYLKKEMINDIKVIESRLQIPLNDSYRQFIFQDIRRQLDQRVADYLKDFNNKEILDNKDQIEQIVFDKVKRDILKGVEAFIIKIKQGGDV